MKLKKAVAVKIGTSSMKNKFQLNSKIQIDNLLNKWKSNFTRAELGDWNLVINLISSTDRWSVLIIELAYAYVL